MVEDSIGNEVIIDSAMSYEEAIAQNPDNPCPKEILLKQQLIEVQYLSFDGKIHQGQIVVDQDLVEDVKATFVLLLAEKFPVTSAIPISDPRFRWDDETSMQANNSSGFNYRTIAKSTKLSNHALGQAFDINPKLNPYIREDFVQPEGAVYDPSKPGTLTPESKVVAFLKEKGWEWGGEWKDRKDYQHFEKPSEKS